MPTPHAPVGTSPLTDSDPSELAALAGLSGNPDLFRTVFEHSNVGKALLLPDRRFLCVNAAFRCVLGSTPTALAGRRFTDMLHADDQHRCVEAFDEIFVGVRREFRSEVRFMRADGSVHWADFSTRLVDRDHEKPAFQLAEIVESTARHEVMEAMLDSQSRISLAIESGDAGLWDWELPTDRLYFNEYWAGMLGYRPGELEGMIYTWRALVHPDDQPAAKALLVEHFVGWSDRYRCEHRLRRKDGSWAWVVVRGKVVERDERHRPRRVTGTITDVSARRAAEDRRAAIEAQALETQKFESLGVLAGGIAHDFNNLLTAILGNANLARSILPPGGEAAELLGDVEQGALRAAELTRQLLAYAGKGRFVVEPVDLSAVVREMHTLLDAAVSKSANLEYDLAVALPPIEADTAQVRQVVMNLLTNASDSLSGRVGTITVRTGRACVNEPGKVPAVFLEVRDTGAGMDEATRKRIFEPFFTTKVSGRGLGLAATLGIVQHHRGEIQVTTIPGEGSIFRLVFPVHAGLQPPPASAAVHGDEWRGRGTLLVVDDEPSVREIASRLLSRIGFDVVTAANGIDALKIFDERAGGVAIVLLDLTMPQMSGAETLRELRRRNPALPVVITSGYTESELDATPEGEARVGFVQKPFARADLVNALRQALDAA